MDLRICSTCKKPLCYEDGKPVNKCDCETPTKPWECDEEIYPLLHELWRKGYVTTNSCSGHPITRWITEACKTVIATRYDFGGYISIDADTVKVKDFMKYKYGNAYIDYLDPKAAYINEMTENGIELPSDYVLSSKDPIFRNYASDFYQPDFAKTLVDSIDSLKPSYSIRMEWHETSFDINNYLKLLEYRCDMAKLIDLLPINTKED
jgi:hypothetical protein